MNSDHLSLSFQMEKDDTLATLETVFATARRGNVRVTELQLSSPEPDDRVFMALSAENQDLLDLFLARLHNIIGVHNCCVAAKPTLALMA